ISKLSKDRVENVTDVLHEGDEVPVKLVEIDRMGRMNLSYIEAIDPTYVPPKQEKPQRERSERFGRDRDHDRDRDRDRGFRRRFEDKEKKDEE
ncbi:MAG: S1 RNA-binding domain-containing protein, partial [Spirochaetia bacterium]|nr:S1 RNA-binding domain-containing protein [Spirochaetia bacterium]